MNDDMRKKLNNFYLLWKILDYHNKSYAQLLRMEENKLLKLALEYGPLGRRNVWCPGLTRDRS